uniref:Leucine rich repeat containing 27 n=1 Tax=Naja naja TaxID=35670 RepID=A0A8C6YE61_NAJNA
QMEEKWYYIENNGSGDNRQNTQRRSDSVSSSSRRIHRALEKLVSNSAVSLDLSRKDLQHLTAEIYRLFNLRYLHLEGNALSVIPEDFFQSLSNLTWLDLRYNKLKELPSGIGCHKQLKTLLLERNPIKRLPVELGKVASLTALNLRNCPLEFPPLEVIQKGLSFILCFLRKSSIFFISIEMPPVEKLNLADIMKSSLDLSDGWPNEEEMIRFKNVKQFFFISIEMPPVEKLNLADIMKSSLDLSDGWPNEEEMIRFKKLRDELIQDERQEYPEDKIVTNESMPTLRRTRTKESLSNHLYFHQGNKTYKGLCPDPLVRQLQPVLDRDALHVTHALVTSRLDYCNALFRTALFPGSPMLPPPRGLHWLPVPGEVQGSIFNIQSPSRHGSLLFKGATAADIEHQPPCTIPQTGAPWGPVSRAVPAGGPRRRAYSVAAPDLWNQLPWSFAWP